MATAFDVLEYIESRLPGATEVKLCKLAYYAQAWHLVWEGTPLFDDRIPPSPPLSNDERSIIDAVLDFYGGMSAGQLRKLSHTELPWSEARGDIPDGEKSEKEITVASMLRYFTKKAMSDSDVPRRLSRHAPMPTSQALAISAAEAPRWRETLARLAQ
jgi:hypothetical protein